MYHSPETQFIASKNYIRQPQIDTLLEKGSGVMNEDVLLVSSGVYGVFDGATSLIPGQVDGKKTGGLMAAEISAEAFRTPQESLIEAAKEANRLIHRKARLYSVNYLNKEELWSTSAAVVELEEDSFSWCQIGDCTILVLYADGGSKLLGSDYNHDLPTLAKWKRLSVSASAPMMQVMAEDIKVVRRRMNVDYGVLNGEPEALVFLKSGEMSLDGVSDILLFSDGLLLPQRNPSMKQNHDVLVSLYRSGGLGLVRSRVRELQQGDQRCSIYPRFKTHDDIGAIALNFTSL